MEDLFRRLERERQDADRRYNEALTALDRAQQAPAADAPPPLPHDVSQIERLNHDWKIVPDAGLRTDASIAGRLRALVLRIVAPTFQAQQRFNAALVEHVNRNAAVHQQARGAWQEWTDAARRDIEGIVRFEWHLLQFLQTITAYVDTKDREAGGAELRDQIGLMQQRLVMVERQMSRGGPAAGAAETPRATSAAPAAAPPMDLAPVKYLGFEDRFRGTTDDIRERLAPYVPILESATDVLDIGCGRGELLELLRTHGIAARGIDANEAMVAQCQARGLAVEQADALGYLEAQPGGSIGALVAIQVVEHLEPAYLLRLLDAAYHALRPGFPLVLETINPACWMAFFEAYIRDLTHVRPLHPDTLRYLVQASGFTSVNVEYRQPVTDADRLDRVAVPPAADATIQAIGAAVNAHADKLNQRLFSSMDYAVIARR